MSTCLTFTKITLLALGGLPSIAQPSELEAMKFSGLAPVSVDGDLSDWRSIGVEAVPLDSTPPLSGTLPPKGPEELRSQFRILADTKHVYVAIEMSGGSASGLKLRESLAKIAQLQFYGGRSLETLRYRRNRGLDGILTVFVDSLDRAVLGGAALIGGLDNSARMLSCPHLWTLLGVQAALKRQGRGYAVELSIPFDALAWPEGSSAGKLGLDVRVFGQGEGDSIVSLGWSSGAYNEFRTNHEMLGQVTFVRQMAGRDETFQGDHASTTEIRAALREFATGETEAALSTLYAMRESRTLPLIATFQAAEGRKSAALEALVQVPAEPGVESWVVARRRELGEPPDPSRPVKLTAENPLDEVVSSALSLSREGRWEEAMSIFHELAEKESSPVLYRAWALLQIQKRQYSAGDLPGSFRTGMLVQRLAADGDPNRAVSFWLLLSSYYRPQPATQLAEMTATKVDARQALYTSYEGVLQQRKGGIGCRQGLELGELLRIAGKPRRAAERFRIASQDDNCPAEDRAWALLRLQKVEISLGEMAAAMETTAKIEDAYADEWEIRTESLDSLGKSNLSAREREAYQKRMVRLHADLSVANSAGSLSDRRMASSLLRTLDAPSVVREASTAGLVTAGSVVSFYSRAFRYVELLRRADEREVAAGRPDPQFRSLHKRRAGLTDTEAAQLEARATEAMRSVESVEAQAKLVIERLRSEPRPASRPTGSPSRPLNSALGALEEQRKQAILATYNTLRSAFGDQRLAILEAYLSSRFNTSTAKDYSNEPPAPSMHHPKEQVPGLERAGWPF